jgi:hypothetical protein
LFSLAHAKIKDQFFRFFSLRFALQIFSSLHFLQSQVSEYLFTVYAESCVVDPHHFYTAQAPRCPQGNASLGWSRSRNVMRRGSDGSNPNLMFNTEISKNIV